MKKLLATIAVSLLIGSGVAWAQQSMLLGGSWTSGNVPKFTGNYSGQPLLVDSGLPPGSPNVTTVAELPTCSSDTLGLLYVVTDASSPTYGAALTGGSTTVALALCNGSTWRAH